MSTDTPHDKVECIMLVDDDPASNYLTRVLIEEIDDTIRIITTRSSKDALDFLDGCLVSGNCPDLVLLDLNMPGMDGFAFLEALRSSRNPPRRIYILTSSQYPRDMAKAATFPTAGYLVKPITIEQLQKIIGK
jgi:CheY-like chemotaxis protein